MGLHEELLAIETLGLVNAISAHFNNHDQADTQAMLKRFEQYPALNEVISSLVAAQESWMSAGISLEQARGYIYGTFLGYMALSEYAEAQALRIQIEGEGFR